MADFCKHCSIELFGEHTHDLDNLVTAEDFANGLAMPVLCEGCGGGYVDHEGNMVVPSEDGNSWLRVYPDEQGA